MGSRGKQSMPPLVTNLNAGRRCNFLASIRSYHSTANRSTITTITDLEPGTPCLFALPVGIRDVGQLDAVTAELQAIDRGHTFGQNRQF